MLLALMEDGDASQPAAPGSQDVENCARTLNFFIQSVRSLTTTPERPAASQAGAAAAVAASGGSEAQASASPSHARRLPLEDDESSSSTYSDSADSGAPAVAFGVLHLTCGDLFALLLELACSRMGILQFLSLNVCMSRSFSAILLSCVSCRLQMDTLGMDPTAAAALSCRPPRILHRHRLLRSAD